MAGKVLQVATASAPKFATTAVIPTDDTIPQNTEGFEVLTLAFTPLSATSTLYIKYAGPIGGEQGIYALFVDSTADALACSLQGNNTNTAMQPCMVGHSVASGSTSARTYKIRAGRAAGQTANYRGTEDDNGGVADLGILTITEVEA